MKKTALAIIAVGAIALTGCSDKFNEKFKDAPRSGEVNQEAADTITFPDGYSNVATKCDHGNRVYVLFHEDAAYGGLDVVAADPTCPAG